MEEKKKTSIKTIIITAIITLILSIGTQAIIYFSTKQDLTLVFYDIECVNEKVTDTYSEEYVIAYVRLNSKNNHTLEVRDFTTYYNSKQQEAVKVEYFNQSIRTQFETYPNQPILKVYFKMPHKEVKDFMSIKYKNTTMQIGQFATEK